VIPTGICKDSDRNNIQYCRGRFSGHPNSEGQSSTLDSKKNVLPNDSNKSRVPNSGTFSWIMHMGFKITIKAAQT
jgi:hypothetical protein